MVAHWAAAVLYNGLADATRRQRRRPGKSSRTASLPWLSMWALVELVEAAARAGDIELARDALDGLAATTQPAGTGFALGIEARCRALVGEGDDAEVSYREAIERLGRAGNRTELARAHLVFGEWLRREGRLARGARAAAGRRGDVRRDRDGGVRRARPGRAGRRRCGALRSARRRGARASSLRRRSRSPGSPATA